jgi:hypothetical protein
VFLVDGFERTSGINLTLRAIFIFTGLGLASGDEDEDRLMVSCSDRERLRLRFVISGLFFGMFRLESFLVDC